MSRNTLMVAAIVVALVLGAVLWFTLSPERAMEVAGARPAGQGETELSKKPSSDAQNQGTQPGQGGTSGTDGSTGQRTAEIEGETETAAAAPPVAAAEQQAAAESTDTASAEPPAAGAPAASATPPSFDIVRVEKDGSAVIAGRAEPGATVQLFDGDAVIAEGQASGDGSFAVVLDQPLPEGTRRLSLATVAEDGTLVPSEDEVVVVIEGAGSAAGSAPSAAASAAQQSAEATVAAVESATTESAEGTASDTSGETATQAAESAEAATTDQGTATAEATPAPAPSPATEPAAEAQPETTASGSASSSGETTATEPAASAGEATTETQVADTPKLAEQLTAEQGVASASTSAETTSEVAAAESSEPLVVIQPKSGQGASQVLQGGAPAGGKPAVSIEAVDYDLKGQVVISGRGPAGAQVLLYLDHAVLGQATVDGDGRWQFTPEQNVVAGLHKLRADLVGADGSVIARSEIPFQRAEPIQVAANEEFIVVQPGHSLWVIARKRYGEGLQYSAIYQANATQIRDPDLIYPGQIFLMPTVN